MSLRCGCFLSTGKSCGVEELVATPPLLFVSTCGVLGGPRPQKSHCVWALVKQDGSSWHWYLLCPKWWVQRVSTAHGGAAQRPVTVQCPRFHAALAKAALYRRSAPLYIIARFATAYTTALPSRSVPLPFPSVLSAAFKAGHVSQLQLLLRFMVMRTETCYALTGSSLSCAAMLEHLRPPRPAFVALACLAVFLVAGWLA